MRVRLYNMEGMVASQIQTAILASAVAAALVRGGENTAMTIDISKAKDGSHGAVAQAAWVDVGSDAWAEGTPAFETRSDTANLTARGWFGVTAQELLLRVRVADRTQVPAPDDFQLWLGDGLEVGVDVRGDGVGLLPAETPGVMGPDDAKFTVATNARGAVGRCFDADRDENKGLFPVEWVQVEHDSKAGETTYDMRFPWERFETRPGLFPTFGIAIQVNDLDEANGERDILNWGEGTFGTMRPGLFNKIAVGSPKGQYTASVVNRDIVWTTSDRGEVVLAVSGKGSYTIEATLGDRTVTREVKVGKELERHVVSLLPGKTDARTVPFSVKLLDRAGKELERRSGDLTIVDAVYRAINTCVEERLDTATHPLYRRHLLSIKALVAAEWSRLTLYREYGYRGNARETFKYLQTILAGLESGKGSWEECRQGKAELLMAYVSRQDRTTQYYVLNLPKNWDPDKEYPLFLELHGAGSENPLSGLATRLGPDGQELELNGYEDHRPYILRQGNGYWVMPSGRGNLGYRGVGEGDVWEAYDDVHAQFRIDENHRYLFGFSMGGAGTWSLGTRTPDRWAALLIMAGGLWRESGDIGLGRNVSYMPIFVWCGEEDPISASAVPRFKAEIEKYGNAPKVKTVPGLGHNYAKEIQEEGAEWLQTHTRSRPDSFSYVADTDEHLGVWGITMMRQLSVSGAPMFTCHIEGNTVAITSEGTTGLKIALGEDGLGLTGDVVVTWNGETSYTGDVKTITVGEYQEPRRRRR